MKYLLSRYGGQLVILGQGKASNSHLPEAKSLESVLLNHAFKMKDFNYLSSYSLMYDFMGAYKTLPKNAIYIGTLDHTFVELAVPYDPIFESRVYLAKLFYPNLFAVFIKTDFYPFEDLIDYEESTYDCVLLVLFFEMSVKDYNCIFHPSKTA